MAKRWQETFRAFSRKILRRAIAEQSPDDRPFGTSLSKRFRAYGLTSEESIPELKGRANQPTDFD